MKKAFLVLCILTLLCILPASAADVYPEITVTGFEFLVNGVPGNSISEGDSLSASFKLKCNYKKEVSFKAILQVEKSGEIIFIETLEESVTPEDGEKSFSVSGGVASSEYESSEITFHLVSDYDTFRPLAPKGTFSCANPRLDSIIVEKYKYRYDDSSVFTESSPRVIPAVIWADELPVDILIEPVDLTTRLTYGNVSDKGGILKINSVSHLGIKGVSVADLKIEIPEKNQLTDIRINGVSVEGFSKDIYEYNITEGYNGIPEITWSKADASSEITYTAPEVMPGKAVISVVADGEEKIYTVRFVKKVTAALINAGYKRTGANAISTYTTSNLPSLRTVLTGDSRGKSYSNRRVYLKFDSSVLPKYAVIADAELKIYMKNQEGISESGIDVYTLKDKEWYTDSESYKPAGKYPKEGIIASGNTVSVSGNSFSEYKINIKNEICLAGNEVFDLVVMQKFVSGVNALTSVSFGRDETPSMDVYYYYENGEGK